MVIREGDETNASNATVSSSSYTANTGSYYLTDYCYNRLPCGYCTRLDRPCPMVGNVTYQKTTYPGYDPDWWKKVTCDINTAPKVTYNNVTTTMEGNNG